MSLSSLIVQRDVATMRQVEEALARQVIYGGDLVTNLLEVARVDEAVLTPLLAESMQLSPAPAGELPPPSDGVRALVPAEVAVQRSMVPLYADGEHLVLAVAEALPSDVSEQLGFALGMRVEQLGAPAVRVWQSISRTYGVQLERRMARLIGRLSGDATLAGSLPPAGASVPPAPQPQSTRRSSRPPPAARISVPPPVGAGSSLFNAAGGSVRPGPVRRSTLTSFPVTRIPSTASMAATRPDGPPSMSTSSMSAAAVAVAAAPLPPLAADRHALLQRDVSGSSRPNRRRRGPLTLEAARDEAEEALDRDALLDLFFDFSRQFFDYAVLFLVQSDIAEGHDAFGAGASRERVLGIGVPLDLPSLLASAREKRMPVVASAAADGLDAVLLADLQRPREAEVAVIPLVVRTRAVALLVADCAEAGIDRDSIRQVAVFGTVVGKAFERIIVRRKLDGFVAGSRSAMMARAEAPKIEADLIPSSTGVGEDAPPVAAPAAQTETAAGSAHDAETRIMDPPERPENDVARRTDTHTRPAGSNYPGMVVTSPPPPAFNIATVRTISGPPIPREEPDSSPTPKLHELAGIAAAPAPEPAPESAPASESATAPALASESATAPEPARDPASAPKLEVSGAFEAEATALFDDFAREMHADPALYGAPTPDAPVTAPTQSSSFAVSPHRPPPKAQHDSALPLVIVDLETELGAIVDRLVQGDDDEAAEVELLRQGVRAMPAIMARFPGPVHFERARIAGMPNPPRASECGVVLRLVARERKVALPFVLEHLVDPDAEKRGWATHLLCELTYVEALPRLLERLRDEDAATRASAALGIATLSRTHAGRVAQSLRELAADGGARERTAAMRAMGVVRDPALVPTLIHGLGDGNEEVMAAAHGSLVEATRQDFGPDARLWLKWWEHNGGKHRIEWLIDALTHDVAEVRRAAGEELRALSRQYFGYASDLPSRDRERAQQRYRDWWITEGRARHRRN